MTPIESRNKERGIGYMAHVENHQTRLYKSSEKQSEKHLPPGKISKRDGMEGTCNR